MVGVFYVCWLGAERNRILNYGYPALQTSLCLWHIGMDADMADGARIYFFMSKTIPNVEAQRIWQPTASNGESRIKTDRYGSIGEYGQSKYDSYSINIIRNHQLQSATPVICWKTYESAMSFLSVMLCDVKRYQKIRVPSALSALHLEHRKVRGNPRCFKSPLPSFLYLFIRGN